MGVQRLLKGFGLLAFSWLVWLLLIYKLGYFFGTGDHVELLPLVLHKVNPELFQNDFFVQGITSYQPNERSTFTALLLPFASNLEWVCLIGHFCSTLLLISGLWLLFRHFKISPLLSTLSIVLALVWLYGRTLGGVELYYNTFQASNLAKGIGVFAIVCWLRKQSYWAFFLLGIMTLMQITAGLTLGIPMALAHLSLRLQKEGFLSTVKPILLYALIAMPFLISIVLARKTNATADLNYYFQILFEFRHPHHFLLSSHSLRRILLVASFYILGLIGLKKTSPELHRLLLFMGILLLIYIALFEWVQSPFLAGFQFFKTTIWFKPFAFLAAAIFLKQFLPGRYRSGKFTAFISVFMLVFNAVFMNWMIQNPDRRGFYERHWFGQYRNNPEVEISIKAAEILPSEALIVQPFSFTGHKYFGKVSSWVDFKANVRHPDVAPEWYRRVTFLYGINAQTPGFQARKQADRYFKSLGEKEINFLRSEGLSHIITFEGHIPEGCEKLYSNGVYVICIL